MKEIIQNYNSILEQIRIAADEANRDMNEIKLIVVTKKFEAENIKPLLDIGHLYYGENKVQEAARKWFDLKSEYKEIKLSLIGPLQTNKIKLALDLFCSIHSIDREKLVLKLSQYPEKIKNIDEFFIQVNLADEAQKSGVSIKSFDKLLIKANKFLKINGLMCLPPKNNDSSIYFGFLYQMARKNNIKNLSMGMSSDFREAILFGATHIRVGEAIMGERIG
tara:strand:+ start:10491 stop:11153 length:663 start_codon:yes stop_codon:yes gene_type:complete